MCVHDVLYDGEAKPGSPAAALFFVVLKTPRSIRAPKPLEDAGQILRKNSDPRIGHTNDNGGWLIFAGIYPLTGDGDTAAGSECI